MTPGMPKSPGITPPMTCCVLLARSRQSFMLTKTNPPLTSPPMPTMLK